MSGIWDRICRFLGRQSKEIGASGSESEAADFQGGKPSPAAKNPRTMESYQAPGILGLSDEEVRQRALKLGIRIAGIRPIHIIPSPSDERTAIIDRGMIMSGFLSEQQLAEMHRVGDLWLRHNNAEEFAARVARAKTGDVLQAMAQQKEAEKEEKRRLSALKKAQRAAAIARRKAEDIFYLGPGVSAALVDRRSNIERLQQLGLPVLSTPAEVAGAMGLTVPQLRWLAFHSEAAERTHYTHFLVPKRSGGMRQLSAPHKKLARAQNWILHSILEKLSTESPAHGFIRGRSIMTNAVPHLRKELVVNLDLKDFFPTITFPRVRGVFRGVGYSPAVATILALLCTESPRQQLEYDGQAYFVAMGPRVLPQGACTSPALSNQIAKKLDRRLRGMGKKEGWTYTRYADDLTFSLEKTPEKTYQPRVAMLLARVRHIVVEEGFVIHASKGRIQRPSGRQTVTGIIVNQKPGILREEVRRLRAIVHGAQKTGLAAQNRQQLPYFEAWLRGKIAYLCMVDCPKGLALLQKLNALRLG